MWANRAGDSDGITGSPTAQLYVLHHNSRAVRSLSHHSSLLEASSCANATACSRLPSDRGSCIMQWCCRREAQTCLQQLCFAYGAAGDMVVVAMWGWATKCATHP